MPLANVAVAAAGAMVATSMHRGRRARAECCMAAGGAGAGAFDTENNETERINGRRDLSLSPCLYSEKHYE